MKKKSHRGAWSMPGAQTTTLSDHDESTNRHPWRDQTPSCSPSCSIQARSVLTAVPASFRGRFAQQQTNEASRPPQHGFSGTRVVGATEEVVHRPARARLPDAEQTRAKTDEARTTHSDIWERSDNSARLHRREKHIACPCKGPHRGEAIFNCRWTAQVSISRPKTMAASRRCSITRTPLEHGDRKNLA